MKKLKVFHGPVNYGTQAGLLAIGLRELGVCAESYTNNDPYNRVTDFQFKRRKSILSKILYYKIVYPVIRFVCFFRYNTFHFYFGRSLNSSQWDLPFYRLFGKKVVMHYLGNDIELYEWSVNKYEITNMDYFMTPEEGQVHDLGVKRRRSFEKKFIDKEYVCAPQYAPFVDNPDILPLAINIQEITQVQELKWKKGDILRLLHAPTNRKKKGTKYLIEAIEKLTKLGYEIELNIVEGVTHAELLKAYENCHVSVNALLGGWYGTAGIEAMAVGRPLISFIRPEFINMIGIKPEKFPIISANKDTIYNVLLSILEGRESLTGRGRRCRKFVEHYHDYKKISSRLLNDYQRLSH